MTPAVTGKLGAFQAHARSLARFAGRQQPRRNTRAMASGAEWTKQDKRRMLHAVYRVGNMDKTLQFYKDCLGMKELRGRDMPDEKYRNAFLGFGSEKTNFALELTYNYGREEYDIGEQFGHFAVATTDVYKLVDQVKAAGGKVTREPGPVKGGQTHIAFVEDPTGYKWELIQREKESSEPLAQVMLRVTDLDKSIKYYEDCIGMKLLRKRENKEQGYTLAFMSYGPEEDNCVFELTYNHGRTEPYSKGDGYAQVAIATEDVYKTCDAIREAGGEIQKEAQLIESIGTKIMATLDPDGAKIVFVDNADFLKELE